MPELNKEANTINNFGICKHIASCTSVDQVVIHTPFLINKKIPKSILNDKLAVFRLRQLTINQASKLKDKGRLNLMYLKQVTLLDFLLYYCSIISRSIHIKAVACGFVDNGMIDIKASSFSNYYIYI